VTVGAPIQPSFEGLDHYGRAVTDASYRGKYLLVLFGFTHCKVVCPRALARLARVLDSLGPLANELQALYVTVDPERDTPRVMQAYLAERAPRVIGLTGTRAQIDAAKHAFRVFARRVPGASDEDYDVPHTAISYLIDQAGRYRAHFSDAVSEEELLESLRVALTEGGTGRNSTRI
jgi:protein SCO1